MAVLFSKVELESEYEQEIFTSQDKSMAPPLIAMLLIKLDPSTVKLLLSTEIAAPFIKEGEPRLVKVELKIVILLLFKKSNSTTLAYRI